MEPIKVISKKNFPSRLPVTTIALSFIAMDIYHAPGWVFGAVGAWWCFIIGIVAHRWGRQEEVDILNKEKNQSNGQADANQIHQRRNAANS